MGTVHIESGMGTIADIVLMPGDPKRSEYIAKKFLKNYTLVNSVRGMAAYTGYYKDRLVTIFPSGMGNPSMGIYSYELFHNYGVEKIIRIGSCGVYLDDIVLNDLILVTGSYSESSYENQLVGEEVNLIESSDNLNLVIESVADSNKIKIIKGNIYCSDVFYESDYDYRKRALEKNVLGIEMETFALFHNARMLGKEATALLTVSDLFYSDEKLTSSEREKSLDDMIVLALESCLKL